VLLVLSRYQLSPHAYIHVRVHVMHMYMWPWCTCVLLYVCVYVTSTIYTSTATFICMYSCWLELISFAEFTPCTCYLLRMHHTSAAEACSRSVVYMFIHAHRHRYRGRHYILQHHIHGRYHITVAIPPHARSSSHSIACTCVHAQASGSDNKASDYDLTVTGPKAVEVVKAINADIESNAELGSIPSGIKFDTNAYYADHRIRDYKKAFGQGVTIPCYYVSTE